MKTVVAGAVVGGVASGALGVAQRVAFGRGEAGLVVHAVRYVVAGAAFGAQSGAALSFLGGGRRGLRGSGPFGTVTKMTPKLMLQVRRLVERRLPRRAWTSIAFAAGAATGVVAGSFGPAEVRGLAGAAVDFAYGGGHLVEAGFAWARAEWSVGGVRTPGGVQLGLTYVSGVALGFNLVKTVRRGLGVVSGWPSRQ
jgi:hypothetical protein